MRNLRDIVGEGTKYGARWFSDTPMIRHKKKIYAGTSGKDTHADMMDRHKLHKANDDDLKFGHKTSDGKHVWYEGKK